MKERMDGMLLNVKASALNSTESRVMMHIQDCRDLEITEMDRVLVEGKESVLALVHSTGSLTPPGTMMMPFWMMHRAGLQVGDQAKVSISPPPESVQLIRRSMDRQRLEPRELHCIVRDAMEGRLSKAEVSAWLTAIQINGLSSAEVHELTLAMTGTGCSLDFDRHPVFDFHSVGGVPGNKVTPIVVSIVAAAGLMLPKTSSRAISSACGTADFVEVFCDVSLNGTRLKDISERTGGVFAWGGAMNITPVSRVFIDVQYPLGIDPRSMMLASIMSKKLAMGTDYLLMDIPMGGRTKVKDMEEAQGYARDFIELGKSLGIKVECAITDGSQPIGYAIGPALEARECIQAMEGETRLGSVREKSVELAGMVMEMGGIPNGRKEAQRILDGGLALAKFREIVAAQGGRPDIGSHHIILGGCRQIIQSTVSGYVLDIHNKKLVAVARAAGSPKDKGGGILLYKKMGERVERGEPLMEIFADNPNKAERARDLALGTQPLTVGGMVIGCTRDSTRYMGL
jgi:AMP phosphorylase